MNYTEALNQWLERAKNITVDGKLSIMEGKKYLRIVKEDISSRYAFCFIEKATGNVLKAASWSTPAKHARGNIYRLGSEGIGQYGGLYL